tara:strand:+ start:1785 stop:1973 length:189 start_codon:yes stop_codon:yes gene_type:complete
MLIKPYKNLSITLIFQLIASTSWMVSIFIYGSFSLGDYFQLLASSAWTIANIITFYKKENKK